MNNMLGRSGASRSRRTASVDGMERVNGAVLADEAGEVAGSLDVEPR